MTPLTHLTDTHAIFGIEQWTRCHPLPDEDDGLGLDYGAPRDFEAMAKRHAIEASAIEAVSKTLSLDEIADLEAVYQIGRLNQFAEYYDRILQLACQRRRLEGDDLWQAVHYLLTKTNLQTGIVRGMVILGRPDLAPLIEAVARAPASR